MLAAVRGMNEKDESQQQSDVNVMVIEKIRASHAQVIIIFIYFFFLFEKYGNHLTRGFFFFYWMGTVVVYFDFSKYFSTDVLYAARFVRFLLQRIF